jgi:hypothetical protein
VEFLGTQHVHYPDRCIATPLVASEPEPTCERTQAGATHTAATMASVHARDGGPVHVGGGVSISPGQVKRYHARPIPGAHTAAAILWSRHFSRAGETVARSTDTPAHTRQRRSWFQRWSRVGISYGSTVERHPRTRGSGDLGFSDGVGSAFLTVARSTDTARTTAAAILVSACYR